MIGSFLTRLTRIISIIVDHSCSHRALLNDLDKLRIKETNVTSRIVRIIIIITVIIMIIYNIINIRQILSSMVPIRW